MADGYDRFDNEGGGNGSFIMGLLTGTVLGAGLGMLFAPKAGSDLRSQLNEQAGSIRGTASEGYRRASEAAGEWTEKGRDIVDKASEKGRDIVDKVGEKSRDIVDKAKDAASRGAEEAQRYARDAKGGAASDAKGAVNDAKSAVNSAANAADKTVADIRGGDYGSTGPSSGSGPNRS